MAMLSFLHFSEHDHWPGCEVHSLPLVYCVEPLLYLFVLIGGYVDRPSDRPSPLVSTVSPLLSSPNAPQTEKAHIWRSKLGVTIGVSGCFRRKLLRHNEPGGYTGNILGLVCSSDHRVGS